MRRVLLPIVFLLTVFISCEQDNYEKGEGRYSLMRGDFAELRIDADLPLYGEMDCQTRHHLPLSIIL